MIDVPFCDETLARNSFESGAFDDAQVELFGDLPEILAEGMLRARDLQNLADRNHPLEQPLAQVREREPEARHANARLAAKDLLLAALHDITTAPEKSGVKYGIDDPKVMAEVARTGRMIVIEGWDDRFDGRFSTPEKAADQQRQVAQKMEEMGQLTIGIAHHFNNLPQDALGNLSLVVQACDESQKAPLEDALRPSRSQAELVGQFMAYARRGPKPEFTAIDIEQWLDAVTTMCRQVFDRGIEFQCDVAADVVVVAALLPGPVRPIEISRTIRSTLDS